MGRAVESITQPFADLVKDTGGNVGNLIRDTGSNLENWIGGPVGDLIGDTSGNVGNLVKDSTSSGLSQDLYKAALLAGTAYVAAPYILGEGAAAGTGAAAGSSGVIPAGASAGGTALATGGGGAAYGSAGTLAGASSTGSLLPGALASSSFSGLGTGETTMAGTSILDSALDFAKTNPQLTGSLLGSVTGALSAANAPTSQTATTSIDPQIKAEYLANLERAKAAAAGLAPRQYADPGQMYTQAEGQLYNLGMTPFGAADIQQFYNPYENQVVQNTLSDIERSRQMQALRDQEQATASRAFGGSRQGVQSALTNEAALRTAATTAAGLRQTGYTQAANLGLAARPMNISGLQTSLGLASQRDALAQARLDAERNAALERLQITSGALGLQPANTGGTSTTPLYSSTLGSALGGALSGAYIGSLLQPKA